MNPYSADLIPAVHEAAHASSAVLAGFRVVEVSIEPVDGLDGRTRVSPTGATWAIFESGDAGRDETLIRRAMTAAAGYRIAPEAGASLAGDWREVEKIETMLVSDSRRLRYWSELRTRLNELIARERFRLLQDAFVAELLRRGRLDEERAREVVLRALG